MNRRFFTTGKASEMDRWQAQAVKPSANLRKQGGVHHFPKGDIVCVPPADVVFHETPGFP